MNGGEQMARITRHATQRMRQRLGISKRTTEKNAEKALAHGIKHSDTRGSLHRYISSLYWKEQTANNARIYNNSVYIFHNNTLITVFPLPQKYRKTAEHIRRKNETLR